MASRRSEVPRTHTWPGDQILLWKEDYDEGKYEASKDRPCAIVLAAKVKDTAATQVVVIPITHSEPDPADASASLEMPAAVAKSIGLDAGRHWLRLT